MNIKQLSIILIIFFIVQQVSSNDSEAILFEFDDKDRDEYFQNTLSKQSVFLNNKKVYDVQQLFKGIFKVNNNKENQPITRAVYSVFRLNPKDKQFHLKKTIKTQFQRKKNGELVIDDKYRYPALRNIPRFHDKKVKINDSWTGISYISQDLSNFGIKNQSLFKVNSRYRYIKDVEFKGQNCAVFSCFYIVNVNFNQEIIKGKKNSILISRWIGTYEAEYFYSIKEKMIRYFKADFNYLFYLTNGNFQEFKGTDIGEISKKQ